jgi:hypothetical protein
MFEKMSKVYQQSSITFRFHLLHHVKCHSNIYTLFLSMQIYISVKYFSLATAEICMPHCWSEKQRCTHVFLSYIVQVQLYISSSFSSAGGWWGPWIISCCKYQYVYMSRENINTWIFYVPTLCDRWDVILGFFNERMCALFWRRVQRVIPFSEIRETMGAIDNCIANHRYFQLHRKITYQIVYTNRETIESQK